MPMQSSKEPVAPHAHGRTSATRLLTVTEKPAEFHQDLAALLPWKELRSGLADLQVVAKDPDENSGLTDWGCGETRDKGAGWGFPVRMWRLGETSWP